MTKINDKQTATRLALNLPIDPSKVDSHVSTFEILKILYHMPIELSDKCTLLAAALRKLELRFTEEYENLEQLAKEAMDQETRGKAYLL